MKRFPSSLVAIAALLAAPSLFAQGASQPASGWGTPLAPARSASAAAPAAASTPDPAASTVYLIKPAPSAFASARATSTATGEYFHDFGELIVRVRSVKWIEEICSEAFPTTAETNEHAYDDWLMEHGDFVKEVESQFEVIGRYWSDVSPQARKDGFNVDALRAKVESNKDGLRTDFHATSAVTFQRRCDAYPEILLSPQLDLEKSQADYVTSMRRGPR